MREKYGESGSFSAERLVSIPVSREPEPIVRYKDFPMHKLSRPGQFVSSSFPDNNVDGSFPPNEIDIDIVGIAMERQIYRSLPDLEVCNRDFLEKVRQPRG